MRCSSIAQTSTVAPGCLRRSSAAAVWSFFERGTILLGRGPRMPWPRLLDRIADRNKRVPATLIVHGCEPMEFGEPARNFRPRPQAAVIRRRLDPLLKRSQPFLRIKGSRVEASSRRFVARHHEDHTLGDQAQRRRKIVRLVHADARLVAGDAWLLT